MGGPGGGRRSRPLVATVVCRGWKQCCATRETTRIRSGAPSKGLLCSVVGTDGAVHRPPCERPPRLVVVGLVAARMAPSPEQLIPEPEPVHRHPGGLLGRGVDLWVPQVDLWVEELDRLSDLREECDRVVGDCGASKATSTTIVRRTISLSKVHARAGGPLQPSERRPLREASPVESGPLCSGPAGQLGSVPPVWPVGLGSVRLRGRTICRNLCRCFGDHLFLNWQLRLSSQ